MTGTAPHRSRLAKVTLAADNEPKPELVTWSCKEAYVYVPIPPASSYGHRADTWDVDKWFKALTVKVVSVDDDLVIRLSDQTTDELFAECPMPNDGTPLTTAVTPVVDSSRYFVVRVVDEDTKNHAFIGLGFRDRGEASAFTSALDDYRQYLRRKQEAAAMRAAYEAAGEEGGSSAKLHDYSLKEGQTLKLNFSLTRTSADAAGSSAEGGASEPSTSQAQPAVLVKLPPPPSGGAGGKPVAAVAGAAAAGGGVAQEGGGPGGAPTAPAAGHEREEWSEFK